MVISLESTISFRFGDFVRMNLSIFLGSKVGEDPQEFLDGVYMVLSVRGVSREKEKLALYQLREVDQVCYIQWKYNKMLESEL